jgi:glycosyltransferase involved in cell wall biosynthesis
MRIAVWHNLMFGGAKRALFNHLKALNEEGHSIEIWDLGFDKNEILDFRKFGKINVVSSDTDIGQLIQKYKYPTSISETKQILNVLKGLQKKCSEQINKKEFDVVFVNSCSVTYMPFIGEFIEIPSVLYLGEPYRILYEAFPENVWQAPKDTHVDLKKFISDYKTTYSRRIQVRQEINSARTYNKILVNSFYSRESVLKAYGIESELCRLGIDTNLFSPSDSGKDNYVIGMSLLYPPKGTDRAIFLISKLKKSIRPPLYWISNGCDPSYLNYLTEYSKSLDVIFIPLINITDKEVVEKLSRARFMIYTPRLEPFGLSPLEANGCGTVVIGIAEAGVRESLTDNMNGFLLNGVEDNRFIEYAERLLSNSNTAIDLGLKARDFVMENWSLDQLKNNINNALISICK